MSDNSSIMMPSMENLVVSSSPHYHSRMTVRGIMFLVVLALLPAAGAGVWFFGLTALRVLLVCSVACVAIEAVCAKLLRKPLEIDDGSALVTGLLLGMNLPPTAPTWVCLLGSLIAIGLGKMLYGGIGCNPFNPALVGRVALLVGLPGIMTHWKIPAGSVEALSSATPLQLMGAGDMSKLEAIPYRDLFLGLHGGSIGETCALAILIGGIFLIALKIIRWQIPVSYLLTVAVISGIAHWAQPEHYAPALFHLLTGGLLLGAFFMATDMVTTPLSRKGAVIFGVGCGLITSVIRLWGSYPEGVSFSILIMNSLTPLIDRYTAGKPFGTPGGRGLKSVHK